MNQTSALTGSDWAQLREQVAHVQAIIKRRYGGAMLSSTADDLALLQQVLDGEKYEVYQTDELRAVGAAFGNVLEKLVHFEWVMGDDPKGREPALKLKAAKTLVIFPLRIFLDAVTRGDAHEVVKTFKTIELEAKRTRLV